MRAIRCATTERSNNLVGTGRVRNQQQESCCGLVSADHRDGLVGKGAFTAVKGHL